MDVEFIIKNLPTEPSREHIKNIKEIDSTAFDELNEKFCVFKRTDVIKNETPYTECFGFEDEEPVSGYGSKCICTACGNEFMAGYRRGKGYHDSGIYITRSEDESFYAGYVEKDDENVVCIKEYETFHCPYCEKQIKLIAQNEISQNDGNELAIRTQQILNVGIYTAVITWHFQSELSSDGEQNYYKYPHSAIVVDEDGKLHKFYFWGEWQETDIDEDKLFPEAVDDLQSTYRDDNSINYTKIGGYVDDDVPDLEGKTGEKSGLAEYIEAEGQYPVVYLQNWEFFRNIENLQKSPFGKTLAKCIDSIVDRNIEYQNFPTGAITDFNEINYKEVKPHKMLGISKQELKDFENITWDIDEFQEYSTIKNNIFVSEYAACIDKYGIGQTSRLFKFLSKAPKFITTERIQNYLIKKHTNNKAGMEMFLDYIDMLEDISTEEVVFPPNLQQAHDNQSEIKESLKLDKYKNAFNKVKNKYSGIEWNDGKYCVILPEFPKQLIDEGKTLRHCVGSYCKTHAAGQSIILFVRKYRRPERSYYTLNISFEGTIPIEKQLHGYGNERHGRNKQYVHKIPADVRAFVDRWKKEVLKPWYIQQVKSEKQKTA